MTTEAGAVTLSVVIAHPCVDEELRECVLAHRSEMVAGDELLVVLPSECDRTSHAGLDTATVLTPPTDNERALTPDLWAIGIRHAVGDYVRVTIGCMRPEPGWRAALLALHTGGTVAVGGPIQGDPKLRPCDLAIFLQRYRMYRPPLEVREVADIPADHSSYRRDALTETAALWASGFWERDVNIELSRRGSRLVLDPTFCATYTGGESARRFLAHRFRHGIQFGRGRLVGRGLGIRLAYICALGLPGLVFLCKIIRETLAKPGWGRRLLLALPCLSMFVSAWSLGEWIGAVRGPKPPNSQR